MVSLQSWIQQIPLSASSKHDTSTQCCFNVGPRLRRWPNIKTTLGRRLVLAGPVSILKKHQIMLYQRWMNLSPSQRVPLSLTAALYPYSLYTWITISSRIYPLSPASWWQPPPVTGMPPPPESPRAVLKPGQPARHYLCWRRSAGRVTGRTAAA